MAQPLRSPRALFEAALALPAPSRRHFLAQVCADDTALARRVARLLDADELHCTPPSEAAPTAASASAERPPVSRVGPWRLGALLGRGGMAEVWAADRDDGLLAQAAAVKFIRGSAQQPVLRRRFATECDSLARLRHPHIVRLFDAGELVDGTAYAVMERVEGQSLLRYVELHGLDLDARLRLLLQVVQAVAAAHEALIIHRDLKPANVLVDTAGQVRLLDFGIAKALDLFPGEHTATMDRAYTPDYAAPEQVRGCAVSAATDVYALGVILFELLCGERPHALSGLSPAAVEQSLRAGPADPPSARLQRALTAGGGPAGVSSTRARSWLPRLRSDLDAIALKALRPEASDRYPSAWALLEDLENALQRRPVRARQGQTWYRLRVAAQRWRRPLLLVAVTVAVLGVALTWGLRAHDSASDERERSSRLARVLTDTIEAADPRSGLGLGAAAPALLQNTALRIDQDLTREPGLQADLKLVVGEALLALGLPRQARTHFATAADLLGDAPETTERRWSAIERQARSALLAGDRDEAERLYRLGLAANTSSGLQLRLELGLLGLQLDQGHSSALHTQLSGLRERIEAELGPGHPLALRALRLDVTGHVSLGHFAEAQVLNDLLAQREAQHLHPRHPDRALTLWRQADLARRLGHSEQSLTLAKAVVSHFEFIYGADSAAMVSALSVRGNAEMAAGDPMAALASTRAALALAERHYSADEPQAAMLHYNVAELLAHKLGRAQEAEQHYRQSLTLARNAGRGGHPTTGLYALAYGRLLNGLGRYAEARDELLVAHSSFPERNLRRADADLELATSEAALGQTQSARQRLARALPELRQARGSEDASVRRATMLSASLQNTASLPRPARAGVSTAPLRQMPSGPGLTTPR